MGVQRPARTASAVASEVLPQPFAIDHRGDCGGGSRPAARHRQRLRGGWSTARQRRPARSTAGPGAATPRAERGSTLEQLGARGPGDGRARERGQHQDGPPPDRTDSLAPRADLRQQHQDPRAGRDDRQATRPIRGEHDQFGQPLVVRPALSGYSVGPCSVSATCFDWAMSGLRPDATTCRPAPAS